MKTRNLYSGNPLVLWDEGCRRVMLSPVKAGHEGQSTAPAPAFSSGTE